MDKHPPLLGKHGRNDVLAEVVGAVLLRLILNQLLAQAFPGEDIDPHRSQGAFGMLRFLLKFYNPVVFIDIHDAKTRRLLKRDVEHRDGAVGAGLLVAFQHLGVVHPVDMVPGKDRHILWVVAVDEADVLIDSVRGSGIPVGAAALLVGGQNMYPSMITVQIPGLSAPDIIVELQRLVLGENSHRIDAGIDAVGKGKVNDAVFPAVGDGRFGQILSQRVEAASLSARQQHCQPFLLVCHCLASKEFY